MSRAASAAMLLLSLVSCAHALQLAVSSTPSGAEVFASPLDEPVVYRKGVTPCAITLSDDRGPHTLLLRKAGYFDCYPTAVGAALEVALASRDDPAAWAHVPRLDDTTRAWPPTVGDEPDLPTRASRPRVDWCCFAPDASGVVVRGDAGHERLVALGLAKPGENREASELWWVPLRGEASLLWRTVSAPGRTLQFFCDADFAPSPNWLVHSAYVNNRERLDLLRLSDRKRITIAADRDESLYWPVFSSDGRRVACVSQSVRGNREGPMAAHRPAAIEVMSWDGSARRVVAQDACIYTPPAFSPDGSEVAFVTSSGQIAAVRLDTKQVRTVAHRKPWWPLQAPIWSPDGTKLAYTAFQSAAPDSPEQHDRGYPRRTLWVTADGAEMGEVRGVELHGWHDNGSLDVYGAGYSVEAGAATRSLLQVDLAGRLMRILRQTETLLHSPEISPDGKSVAAVGWGPGKAPAVAIVSTNSGWVRWVELPSVPSDVRSEAAGGAGFPARQAEPKLSPPPAHRLHWLEPTAVLLAMPDGSQHVIDTETLTAEPTSGTALPAAPHADDPRVLCLDGDLYFSDPTRPYPRRWLTTFAWYGPLGPNTLREEVAR